MEKLLDRLKVHRAEAHKHALLFFYAGHGEKPLNGDRVNLVLHGGVGGIDPFDVADVAFRLRQYRCHHTLMVLNSCFSGATLNRASG